MSSSRSAWDVEALVIVAECNSQGGLAKKRREAARFARAPCHPERSEGSAFRGLDASIASNWNNSWDANLREFIANRSVLGMTPCATSRDFFWNCTPMNVPAHPQSNHGSLSDEFSLPTVEH